MLDRRQLLLAGLATAAGLGSARAAPSGGDGERLIAVLDQGMNQALMASPQLMTLTGLDTGANAGAKHRLDDRSPAGLAQMRGVFEELARQLTQFQPDRLRGIDLVNYRSATYLVETTLQSYAIPYGEPGVGAVPYVISQLNGGYRNTPTFLANQHGISSSEDAEAYLDRLAAFDTALDQETERARADFARGATPPDFILRRTIEQLNGMVAPDPAKSELVTNLVGRTTDKKIAGDWQVRATDIVASQVYPAMRRQLALLQRTLPTASSDAGCWRLPDGDSYYRFAVRSFTTTDMAGNEIHELGLELVKKLTSDADAILKGRGLTKGTVAQRVAALRRDSRQLYPNSDAGRAQLLQDMNAMIEAMRTRLPSYFGTLPRAGVVVQRTPVSIEAGAPGGVYQPPSVDGKRPGVFYINLRDLDVLAKFDLPTLAYHEVLPGHHLQNALTLEAEGVPLLRKMPLFSGFNEGWALYAEQLADEMGAYEGDPLGRLGYFASLLFRAARLVMDSGLHHKRWNRETAVRYMIDTLGEAESTAIREVERYCVQPGQASSYMLGHQIWTRARAQARTRLEDRFDLRAFHDAGLLAGSMPLAVLETHLADWSAGRV